PQPEGDGRTAGCRPEWRGRIGNGAEADVVHSCELDLQVVLNVQGEGLVQDADRRPGREQDSHIQRSGGGLKGELEAEDQRVTERYSRDDLPTVPRRVREG